MEAICTYVVLFGCLAAAGAWSRGHNVFKWFLIGAILGPFGNGMARRLPDRRSNKVAPVVSTDDEAEDKNDDVAALMVLPTGFKSVMKALLVCAVMFPIAAAIALLQSSTGRSAAENALLASLTLAGTYGGLRWAQVWHVFHRAIAAGVMLCVIALAVVAVAKSYPEPILGSTSAIVMMLLALVVLIAPALLFLRPKRVVEIGNPLPRYAWMAVHAGWLPALNPHYVSSAQRFAIDAVVLKNGRRASGILPESLEEYHSFGAEVASPVAGTIVECEDGLPDQLPCYHDPSRPAGNHIAISIDGNPDVHVFVAHLKRGTITVRVGEHVAPGEVVGRLGNSGNTSEPHLHIHAQDSRDGRGVPFTINGRWTIRGTVYNRARSWRDVASFDRTNRTSAPEGVGAIPRLRSR